MIRVLVEAQTEFLERACEAGTLWLAYVAREKIDIIALARRSIALAVTPCAFLGRRRFEFGNTGDPLGAVVEVIGPDCVTVEDLCAWPLRSPGDFATMLGRASVLGSEHLRNPASWAGGVALRAWRTPLEWLQAQGTGIVLLDPRGARPHFAHARGDIQTEDAAHGYALMRASGLGQRSFFFDDGT